MTNLTTIKHEHTANFVRTNKAKIQGLAESINLVHGVNVKFYGRHEYDATRNCYVKLPDKGEMHVFETQTDAYFFLLDVLAELDNAEEQADEEAQQEVETDEQEADDKMTFKCHEISVIIKPDTMGYAFDAYEGLKEVAWGSGYASSELAHMAATRALGKKYGRRFRIASCERYDW